MFHRKVKNDIVAIKDIIDGQSSGYERKDKSQNKSYWEMPVKSERF